MSVRADRYSAMAGYAAPARTSSEPGRLLVSVLLIEIFYSVMRDLLTVALVTWAPLWSEGYETGTTASGLLAQLSSFLLLVAALLFVVRRRHGRGLRSLTGPPGPAVGQFLKVLPLALLVLLAVELLPPWWHVTMLADVQPLPRWLALLPLGLLAILVQTGAEELFYRGFLQQQLAARYRSPWIWMVLPSLFFAVAHWENGISVGDSVQYFIWAFCFGLAAADLTARAGTIGPAVAFHLANNAYAFLFYGTESYPDSGLALWIFTAAPLPDEATAPAGALMLAAGLVRDLLLVALLWLAARMALRR